MSGRSATIGVAAASLTLALVGMFYVWYSIGQTDDSFRFGAACITAGLVLIVTAGIVAIREGYA